jgi:hypothetical protein
MARTSIASSRNHPEVLYAVAAAGDGKQVGAVFRSADGGATFTRCRLPSGTGDQGSYNNCIAVHPDDPAIVAIGWRTGPFISADQGNTWTRSTDEPGGHMHADVHALTYASTADRVDLWGGTDGGVCRSTDGGATWDSRYNKHLRNLQYYGSPDMGASMATFDASPWEPGLHGGATQDNGNVWARAGQEGIASEVRQFEGGDGNTVLFASGSIVLHRNNTITINGVEVGNRIRRSDYNPATHEMDDVIGTVVPAEGFIDGMPMPNAAARVVDPHYHRDGATMLAVVARGNEVHGYFDGAGGDRFRPLGDVGIGTSDPASPRLVTALASHTGGTVLAGTSDGHIYAIDAATGRVTDQPTGFGGWTGGRVSRLLWPTPAKRFAVLSSAVVVRWDPRLSTSPNARPGVWLLTPGQLTSGATGIEYATLATGGAALFACTDFGVEVSLDDGDTWSDAGARLPARPHCRDLSLGLNAAGRPALYVATYGWGAFLADLPEPRSDGLGHIPAEVAQILIGIIEDGGGVEIVNGHVRIVPPRGPARDLAAALVVTALSQQLSGPAAELTARLAGELRSLAGAETLNRPFRPHAG